MLNAYHNSILFIYFCFQFHSSRNSQFYLFVVLIIPHLLLRFIFSSSFLTISLSFPSVPSRLFYCVFCCCCLIFLYQIFLPFNSASFVLLGFFFTLSSSFLLFLISFFSLFLFNCFFIIFTIFPFTSS